MTPPSGEFRAKADLSLADLEHSRAARRTCALSCRFAVLHSDGLWIFDFLLFLALNAISFHLEQTILSSSC